MSAVQAVIQAAGRAESSRAELEAGLRSLHAEHHPELPLDAISWRVVPEGFMFTEGRQSTSSIVSCALERETTLAEREAYMRGVCDLWSDVTGCTDHEVVVAITDYDRKDA